MKKICGILFFFFLWLMHVSPVKAQIAGRSSQPSGSNFMISPSLLYYEGLRERTSQDKKSYLMGDLKLAFRVGQNMFLGAVYQHEQDETASSGYSAATSNNRGESQRQSVGLVYGYATETFHFLFSYFVSSRWNLDTVTSLGADRYEYKGAGLQIDICYKIALWGFFLGPQLSYKMFRYDELITNGGAAASIDPTLEDTKIEPSIVFSYFF